MLNDYAFKLRWNELPEKWREDKVSKVRENLIERETEHYKGDWEQSGYEKNYDSAEEYTRQEIWTLEKVEEYIQRHFPVYF